MSQKSTETLRRMFGVARAECGYRSVMEMSEAIGVHRNLPPRWIAQGYVPAGSIESVALALELDDEAIAELERLERLARRKAKAQRKVTK